MYDHELKALFALPGAIEMDETMLASKAPGKREWGAEGKNMVFGSCQRNRKALAFPIASRGKREPVPLMVAHTKAGSLCYTDDWHTYKCNDIHGNRVVNRKEKGKQKGRSPLTAIEGF